MLNNLFSKSNPIGSWLQIGNPEFTSMMIQSGFDFLQLLNESFTKGRMDNNIVDLTKDQVFDILNYIK
tara:strand:- start:121 stop:324 length:204 start_codon:yes stop_codon:yes gene_type:complete